MRKDDRSAAVVAWEVFEKVRSHVLKFKFNGFVVYNLLPSQACVQRLHPILPKSTKKSWTPGVSVIAINFARTNRVWHAIYVWANKNRGSRLISSLPLRAGVAK
jgi:hypothetical protein